jgi:neutral ceramidase
MSLSAGAAVVDITPRTPCHLAGYGSRDHEHEGVHDPISLRALYVRGEGGDALLVSADILWFMEDIIGRILPELESQLGLQPSNVLLCGTHTHSAPTPGFGKANPEWIHLLERQTVSAAAIAKSRLEEVKVTTARGSSKIGCNRREQLPGGKITLGHNPKGPIDRELIAVSLTNAKRKTVARIANFACHGVVLGPRNYQISSDWPGNAAAEIEKSKGAPFLFLNGGCANVDPQVRVQSKFEPVTKLASEFVRDHDRASKSLKSAGTDDTVAGAEKVIHMPRKLRDIEDGEGKTREIRIKGLRIGPLRVVGFPGEVFSQTTMAVKKNSPHPLSMVCSYTAGGHGGYVPVAEAYDTGGYEVRSSPYAEGGEAVLRAGFLDLLKALS